MIKVRYFLHSKKSKIGTHSLYMDVHVDGVVRLRQAVGETLKETEWNKKKQEVRASHDYYREINARLDRLRLKVHNKFRELVDEEKTPTARDLAAILRPLKKTGGGKETPTTVKQVLEAWAEAYKKRKGPQGAGYARQIKQVIFRLEEWRPGSTATLRPQDLTEAAWQSYQEYLYQDAGLQDTTVAKHVQAWKLARKEVGLPHELEWLKNTYAVQKIKHDLTWKEVLKLANYQKYSDEQVRQAAHLFVIDCQIALRWGDLITLEPHHFLEVETPGFGRVLCIRKRQGKTGRPVMVPLPRLAFSLYQANGNRIPIPSGRRGGTVYQSDYNVLIKKAAKEAGLKRKVTVEVIKKGKVTESQKELHEIISGHMARHTAASRIREAGGNEGYELAQLVLGHAAPGLTAHYAHLDLVQTAERILQAWVYYEKKRRLPGKTKRHVRR
jgi:integrase